MRLPDPAWPPRSSAADNGFVPTHPAAHPRAYRPSARAHRILLVDDEADVLAHLRETLEQAGYAVTCTTSLRVAMHHLEQESFDLVVTDLYLGGTELGYQLADVARARRPAIPVILLTGHPTFAGALEALRTRVAEILVKPLSAHDLVTNCRRTIEDSMLNRRNAELEAKNQILAAVLPRAIEIKDPTTSGHAERVVRYADRLAARVQVGEEDRAALRMAALLHDVGKIGIPDAILTKPGGLTVEEREIIKRHPAMGYEILEALVEHENVRRWVYQHHERWDGKGYPEGIAGEEVALPGRILVIAEVYDALAESRSYKEAWEVSRIVAHFREQAGRQFDPDLAHIVADGLERMGSRFFAATPGMLF